MTLFLRKQTKQSRLEGDTYCRWRDNDYAVVEDTVIGRIYQIGGGPQHGSRVWFLNRLPGGTVPSVKLSGGEPTLDAAKEALKVQYERWKARG